MSNPTHKKVSYENIIFIISEETALFFNEKMKGLNTFQKIFISSYTLFVATSFLYLLYYMISTGTRI